MSKFSVKIDYCLYSSPSSDYYSNIDSWFIYISFYSLKSEFIVFNLSFKIKPFLKINKKLLFYVNLKNWSSYLQINHLAIILNIKVFLNQHQRTVFWSIIFNIKIIFFEFYISVNSRNWNFRNSHIHLKAST